MRVAIFFGATAMFSLVGCTVSSSAGYAPALVVESSGQSRGVLERAVSSLLGRPVMLASDAFTHDSTLIIDRVGRREPSGRRIDARDDQGPELFRLMMQGSQCVLVRQRTQQSVPLDNVRCVAAK